MRKGYTPRVVIGVILFGIAGCNSLTGRDQLPAGTPDPASFNTLQGALGMRAAAVADFSTALRQSIIESGLLTDELSAYLAGASPGTSNVGQVLFPLDERILPEDGSSGSAGRASYIDLQRARGSLTQAVGALGTYGTAAPVALRGEAYALIGYTEILLADFFCSGVPLSTLDFQKDYTYRGGSTTQQLYADAISKFDTAMSLAGDSLRVLNLARVGKGRALLAMDSITAAARIASEIPDGFLDTLAVYWRSSNGRSGGNVLNDIGIVSDQEGNVGLPYRTDADPRTATVVTDSFSMEGSFVGSFKLYFPEKYNTAIVGNGYAPVLIASWIEARLIQAEAALRGHDYTTWLTLLNELRQSAVVPGQAGSLSALSDPGDSPRDSARVALLFRERAYWLFLDGHRQGDARRLLRQYHWPQNSVYPNGAYSAPGLGSYGSSITAPIPPDEDPNPLFHGCFDRAA